MKSAAHVRYEIGIGGCIKDWGSIFDNVFGCPVSTIASLWPVVMLWCLGYDSSYIMRNCWSSHSSPAPPPLWLAAEGRQTSPQQGEEVDWGHVPALIHGTLTSAHTRDHAVCVWPVQCVPNECPVTGCNICNTVPGPESAWWSGLGQVTWAVNAVVIRQADVMVMADLVRCSEYLQEQ